MIARIRFATPADAAAVQAIYAPFCDDSAVSFEASAPSVVQIGNRIKMSANQFPWLLCESDDGFPAGYAYAGPHASREAFAWTVDVAIYIHTSYRRKSIGRALYTSLFSILQAQRFVKALAAINTSNEASIAMHKRCGFTPAARFDDIGFKCGAWQSLSWLQYLLRPLPNVPEAVKTLTALTGAERLSAFESGEAILRSRNDN